MNKEKRDKKIYKRLARENAPIILRDDYDEDGLPTFALRFAVKARSAVTESGESFWILRLDKPLYDEDEVIEDDIIGYLDEGCGNLTGLSRHFNIVNRGADPYTREEEEKIKQQVLSMLVEAVKEKSERDTITIHIDRCYENNNDSCNSQIITLHKITNSKIEVLLNGKKVFMEEHRAFLDDLLGVPPIRQTRHGIAGAVNLLESLLVGDHKFDYLSQESLKNIVCQSIAEDGFRMMRLASEDETRARSARFSQEEIDLHKRHN